MSLIAACPCGARFQARPDLAGKMVKCPKCGQAFQVPNAAPRPQQPAQRPMQQPAGFAASDPLGSFPSAPMGPAGQPAAFRPQAPATLRPPMSRPAARPKGKSKSSSKVWLFVGIGAGGVALLAVVGVIAVALFVPAFRSAREAAQRVQQEQASRNAAASTAAPASAVPAMAAPAVASSQGANEKAWQEFTSSDGEYSIEMPGRPRPQTRMQPTPAGVVMMHGSTVEYPNGAYIVSYVDFSAHVPVQDANQLLDASSEQAAAAGKVESVSPVTVDGFPGRELRFRGNAAGRDFQSHGRLVLAGSRLYTVMWLGDVSLPPPGEVSRFLQSFKITYQPPAADEPDNSVAAAPTPEPMTSTSETSPSTASSGEQVSGDEARRRALYKAIAQVDAMTEADPRVAIMKNRGIAGGAANLEKVYEHNREVAYQAIATQQNMTLEEIKAIRAEGEAKGWPK